MKILIIILTVFLQLSTTNTKALTFCEQRAIDFPNYSGKIEVVDVFGDAEKLGLDFVKSPFTTKFLGDLAFGYSLDTFGCLQINGSQKYKFTYSVGQNKELLIQTEAYTPTPTPTPTKPKPECERNIFVLGEGLGLDFGYDYTDFDLSISAGNFPIFWDFDTDKNSPNYGCFFDNGLPPISGDYNFVVTIADAFGDFVDVPVKYKVTQPEPEPEPEEETTINNSSQIPKNTNTSTPSKFTSYTNIISSFTYNDDIDLSKNVAPKIPESVEKELEKTEDNNIFIIFYWIIVLILFLIFFKRKKKDDY